MLQWRARAHLLPAMQPPVALPQRGLLLLVLLVLLLL